MAHEAVGKALAADPYLAEPLLEVYSGQGNAYESREREGWETPTEALTQQPIRIYRSNQLALSTISNPDLIKPVQFA